ALALAKADLQIDATLDPAFDGVEGKARLDAGALALGDGRMAGAKGTAGFTWRKQALTLRYDLTGRGIDTPQAGAAALGASGVVRGAGGRFEIEGELGGQGLHLGSGL